MDDEIWNTTYPVMKYSNFIKYKDIYNDYLTLLSKYIEISSINIKNGNDAEFYMSILNIIKEYVYTNDIYLDKSDIFIRFMPLPFDRRYYKINSSFRFVKMKSDERDKYGMPYYKIYDNKYQQFMKRFPSFHNSKNFELSFVIVIGKIIDKLINHIPQYSELRNDSLCIDNIDYFNQMINFKDTDNSIEYISHIYNKRIRKLTSPNSFGLNVRQSINAFRLLQSINIHVCFPTLYAYQSSQIGFKIKWMGKGNFTYIAKHENIYMPKTSSDSNYNGGGEKQSIDTIKQLVVTSNWKFPIHYEYSLLRCKKRNVRYIINFISHLMKGHGVHSLPRFYAGGHINCLLIDLHKKTIEIYEPFGLYFKQVFQHAQEQSFLEHVLPTINVYMMKIYGFELDYISTYTIIRDSPLFVNKGVQYFAEHNNLTNFNQKIQIDSDMSSSDTETEDSSSESDSSTNHQIGKIDYIGYCGMWSLLYAHLRVFTGCSPESVLYTINKGIAQRKLDLIRNYTAFIEHEMSTFLRNQTGGDTYNIKGSTDISILLKQLFNSFTPDNLS